MSEIIGVYPGTFDPITLGHLDIVNRASKMVDKLIVGVAVNSGKDPLFSLEERIEHVKEEITDICASNGTKVEVRHVDGLLVKFAEEVGAKIIIRGMRAVSDFDYEFKMSVMNSRLNSDIETVFLMASERQQFVSSMFVKEICRLGGDISSFVTPRISELLIQRYKEQGKI